MHNHSSHIPENSIALFGHSNVGKSLIFQHLTGKKVIVSNYPGTTVEITSGALAINPQQIILDTPGVSTWPAQTEDEQLATKILIQEHISSLIQVGDAKHLSLVLSHAIMLIEARIPMVLVLNMMDEAKQMGLEIDCEFLAKELSVAVIPAVATRREGIDEINEQLGDFTVSNFELQYPQIIEDGLEKLLPHLPTGQISARALGLLFFSKDIITEEWLSDALEESSFTLIKELRNTVEEKSTESLSNLIQIARINYGGKLTISAVKYLHQKKENILEKIGRVATDRFWGIPILMLVLAFFYWFVGVLGAQILVGYLEVDLFGNILTPWITKLIQQLIPSTFIQELLIGEYGIWSMGFTYAIALILPIITTFFLAFGFIEDSGYLSRLAILSNGLFKKIGLNGKAILPMVLGLGCVTMATLTTRTLESRRDRLMVILLLALAVPCSAQLGIILGLLSSISISASLIWAGFILIVLFAVGKLSNKLFPGERSGLIIEIPPMRLPIISNIILKTKARLEWYLKEIIPIFIFGAFLMFMMDKTGVLSWLIEAGKPLTVNWLGLPEQVSAAFVLGFLRRDFGATGLFVMNAQGLLTPHQIIVAMVTITLFIPCIATVLVIAKEKGWATSLSMVALIFPLAFFVGGLLNHGLILINY